MRYADDAVSELVDRAGYRPAVLHKVAVGGGWARAVIDPSHAMALCEGHFPGDPFLPGAYVLGLLVALAEELLRCLPGERRAPCRVESCFFLDRSDPTAELVVEARLGREDRSGPRVTTVMRSAGRVVTRATLRFGGGS